MADQKNDLNVVENKIDWFKAPACYKAPIWKHFKMSPDKTKTLCIHCEAICSYSNGNTTGMKRHIARHHPTVPVVDAKPERSAVKSNKISQSADADLENSTGKTVPDIFGKIKKGSARDINITNALMRYIIKDLRSV